MNTILTLGQSAWSHHKAKWTGRHFSSWALIPLAQQPAFAIALGDKARMLADSIKIQTLYVVRRVRPSPPQNNHHTYCVKNGLHD